LIMFFLNVRILNANTPDVLMQTTNMKY